MPKIDGVPVEVGTILLASGGYNEYEVLDVSSDRVSPCAWLQDQHGEKFVATFNGNHSWRIKEPKFEVGKAYVPKKNNVRNAGISANLEAVGPYDILAGEPLRVAYIEPHGHVVMVYMSTETHEWKTWTTDHSYASFYTEIEG